MVHEKRSGKLVRDKIPDVIRQAGGDPNTLVLSREDYSLALAAKLHEEVEELLLAPDESRAEELADVLEVLHAVANHYQIEWAIVEEVGRKKREDRGGFEGRVWLEP